MIFKDIEFDDKKKKVIVSLSDRKYNKVKNFICDEFNSVDNLSVKLKDNLISVMSKDKKIDYVFNKDTGIELVEKSYSLHELDLFDVFYLKFSDDTRKYYMVIPRGKDEVSFVSIPDGVTITKTIPSCELQYARMKNGRISLDKLKVFKRSIGNRYNEGETCYGKETDVND